MNSQEKDVKQIHDLLDELVAHKSTSIYCSGTLVRICNTALSIIENYQTSRYQDYDACLNLLEEVKYTIQNFADLNDYWEKLIIKTKIALQLFIYKQRHESKYNHFTGGQFNFFKR